MISETVSVVEPSNQLLGKPPTFKDRQFQLRRELILDSVCTLIVERGYESMTMDDVANAVGIAKGSLYKHYESKEALAASAMARLIDRSISFIDAQDIAKPALDRIKDVLRWAVRSRLAGGFPTLPSTSPALQSSLLGNDDYTAAVGRMNERLMAMVISARADGVLHPDVSDEVVLFTIYARTCDPSVDFLHQFAGLDGDLLVESLINVWFGGLAPHKA